MFREPLLQSSFWRVLQEKNGRHSVEGVFGLGLVETLPLVGRYLYLPRGPVSVGTSIRSELIRAASEHTAGWIRVEPGSDEELRELRTSFGAYTIVRAPHTIQPREILVLSIAESEEQLLAQMKAKTRYNIRLAEKHGVTVRFSRSHDDRERFIELIRATTSRKAIRPHPEEYYRNFFQVFGPDECVLAIAEHAGKVLAANLLVFFEQTAYYLHGGSSDQGRNFMAPYALQWESLREAKRRGCMAYDFGGVCTQIVEGERGATRSDWSGITRFKQGFAPTVAPIVFPGTYDIILSALRYRGYRFLRVLQQIKQYIF